MLWLIFSLLTAFCWGCTDLFNKLSADGESRLYPIKLTVCTGLGMGLLLVVLLPFSESALPLPMLLVKYVDFVPAALLYIVSLVVSYVGLRYLDLSIVSPVENASGGIEMLALLIWYLVAGRIMNIWETITPLGLFGALSITAGIMALCVVQKRLHKAEVSLPKEQRKYRFGALALLFPLVFCFMDAASTIIDVILLDTEAGVGIGQIDYLILYSALFFSLGVLFWIYLWIKQKKTYLPFQKSERTKNASALCEVLGNIFYVMAIARNAVLSVPIINAYCIVSLLLSRVVLKEKLTRPQRICVFIVIGGIALLNLSELLRAVRN